MGLVLAQRRAKGHVVPDVPPRPVPPQRAWGDLTLAHLD